MPRAPGGLIAAVETNSLGDAIGLQAGDRLVSIDGHLLRDIIDVQFHSADERFELELERAGRRIRLQVERGYGDELGLTFANPTFDVDIRRCANNCDFCFVKQNAPGMRRSLYIKDDDYRYSFLFGNFVTLTNLTAEDWIRLEEQRLSPLYVSVHATDVDLRRRFLARRQAPDVMEQLHRLAELGIEVHTQVVLVPGLNDGQHLVQTFEDLLSLSGQPVASVGIVPVGLTKYHRGQCRTYTPEESRTILDQLEPWRMQSREAMGRTFAYPSDEWYLVAGRDIPLAVEYDDFPQVENGVGMVRLLLDEWERLKPDLPVLEARAATLSCGTLIAPVMAGIVAEFNSLARADLRLVPVVNRYFGAITTVSGLLAGQDIVSELRHRPLGEFVLLPRDMFSTRYGAGAAPPGTTLDDMTLADMSAQLGVPAIMAGTITEMLEALARPSSLP